MGHHGPILIALAGALLLGSCATQMVCDPNHREHCVATGGAGAAAATTVLAAGLWAGTGCDLQGCRPPFVCNHEKKRCERMRCGEGRGGCPVGYDCDPDDYVCR